MSIKDLLLQNRSYRRFHQTPVLSHEDHLDLIDSVRLSPSSKNVQALKFILLESHEACERIFPYTAWAGYLTDWPGPDVHERPTSYIIILSDPELLEQYDIDVGIAAQSILLTANEKGFGGVMIRAINRKKIRDVFKIDSKYDISLVLALGKPSETVIIEDVQGDNIRYYRDMNGVHHVPKRTVNDLIIDTM